MRASLGRVPFRPGLVVVEAILRAGGVADRIAAYAGDLLALYVAATSYEERHLVGGGQDERFELGLEVIVAGLASFARQAPAP